MSDLSDLFAAQEKTKRWRAEFENASARLELAQIAERAAYLISQHHPVADLDVNREHLRLILRYLRHGSLSRMAAEQGGFGLARKNGGTP